MIAFIWVVLVAAVATPAAAQEQSATREGFVLPSDGNFKIMVFRPDVSVGEQSTGGLNEPNADWTAAARDEIDKALRTQIAAMSGDIVPTPDLGEADAATVAEYQALFKAVTDAVLVHKLFPGNRLPTKKDRFDWTLGEGAQKLSELTGGDYGLFLYTYDSYGSAGRKAAQVVGLLLGVGISSGVHIGYAGLVDLKTGDLVWINADARMGGDVRDAEGAQKRVSQLLEDFPQRSDAKVTVGTK